MQTSIGEAIMKKQEEKEWRETEFRKRTGEIDLLELLKERNKNKKQIIDALDNEIKKIKERSKK